MNATPDPETTLADGPLDDVDTLVLGSFGTCTRCSTPPPPTSPTASSSR